MKVKVAQLCQTVCNPKDYGQNTGVGSLSLLQGIFPTQGSSISESPGREAAFLWNPVQRENVGLLVQQERMSGQWSIIKASMVPASRRNPT